jgi:hypothetical protein
MQQSAYAMVIQNENANSSFSQISDKMNSSYSMKFVKPKAEAPKQFFPSFTQLKNMASDHTS